MTGALYPIGKVSSSGGLPPGEVNRMNMYSFLATPDWLTGNAKTIAIAALAVVALIAIIVGAVKGFTRLNWGALVWGGACALFCLLELKFHDKNPILKWRDSGLDEGCGISHPPVPMRW